ncbi:MAG: hypothetical protein ACI39H_02870 [Lachnospiraceae bacterium]
MKRRVAAALTALLVLTLGTTALAAPSVTAVDVTSAKATQKTVDQVFSTVDTANLSSSNGAEVSAEPTTVENLQGAMEQAASLYQPSEDKSVSVAAMMDLHIEGDIPPEGVGITIPVEGIEEGDEAYVLHLDEEADEWEEIIPDDVSDGEVTATFTSLSPVAVIKVQAADASGVKSDKTGEKAPVWPIAVLLSAAGVVICAKKARG